MGEIFPLFALYKNYTLLACFAGLGLGYALARRESIPLLFCGPVLAFQSGLDCRIESFTGLTDVKV